ncbi:MAG TPA: transposase, partial [Dehalococcoidia bacterium]|nr:transposase [Dehalococcoidia bacterium]
LLSDNGPGYIFRSFGEYLRLVSIRHILASPFHPQTNGKLERYHLTIKLDVNQIPYDVPGNLGIAITEFVNLLQLSALSQGSEERDSLGRLRRSQGTDPGEAKGCSSPHFSAQTIVQPISQRARPISA